MVPGIMLHKVVPSFEFVNENLKCVYSNENYPPLFPCSVVLVSDRDL